MEGVISDLKDGTQQPVTKQITVDVDDLAPLGSPPSSPLGYVVFGYEPHLPRIPPPDYEEVATSAMKHTIAAAMASFAFHTAKMVKDFVKLVYVNNRFTRVDDRLYIPEQDHIQCEAKTQIPCGKLRLYPWGGTVLHLKDDTERREVEQRLNYQPGYMRCVRASAKMSEGCLMYSAGKVDDFLMYSPLPPAFTVEDRDEVLSDEAVRLTPFSPFWHVRLARRDATPNPMVNMIAQMEEFTIGSPEVGHLGLMKMGMAIQIPFLTNTKALTPGDLLLLPFDTGMPETICWETLPPMPLQCNQSAEAISHSIES